MTHPGVPKQRIGFKRHLRAEVVAGDAVYLFSERGVTALAGGRIETLAPLLDGTRDLHALLRETAGPAVSQEQLQELIARLATAGLVGHRTPAEPDDEPAYTYWEATGLDPAHAMSAIASGVQLLTTGSVDRAQAQRAFEAAGLSVLPSAQPAALSVILCDDYLSPELADVNASHQRAGRPWLLARPVGERIWIGPVFKPGEACWHCLAPRLWENRPAEAHVRTMLGRQRPVPRPTASIAPVLSTALGMIALEATKWLAGYRHPGQDGIWTLDSLTLEGQRHEVRRRPQCPSCGDPVLLRAQARRPVQLSSRPKVSRSASGHRALAPEQVFDRYQHLISPISGVVKEIRRDHRGPSFLNVFQSGPMRGRAGCVEGLRSVLRQQSGGKGVTAVQAKTSALCEALERHCATFEGDEEIVRGTYESLSDQAIHPDLCQLFHDRQFQERDHWNETHGAFQYVCDPFDEKAELNWTPVWSLTHQRHRLLPTELLYFGAPRERGPFMLRSDSNGNAAGSTLEDAVLQGLLEVVERDAVSLWWYNRTVQPAVDLDAFADPWLGELREVYAAMHREVWALDLTADLGIPTIVALSRRVGAAQEDLMMGFGSHLDPAVALRRALTEMNQLMPAVIDGYHSTDPDALRWWKTASLANQPYLSPDPAAPARKPDDYLCLSSADLHEDVEIIHRRLRVQGLELLVLDQTRPDIGLPVVKVIVPGMRQFWARFAPGRLFDVPVRLGRLRQPTPYDQLNPFPIFI